MHLGPKIFGVGRHDFFVGVAALFFNKIGSWRDGISKSAYLDMNVKLASMFLQFVVITHWTCYKSLSRHKRKNSCSYFFRERDL